MGSTAGMKDMYTFPKWVVFFYLLAGRGDAPKAVRGQFRVSPPLPKCGS